MARKRSKRYSECVERIPQGPVALKEAIRVLKDFTSTKFDATMELVMHLGIDPRQADQALRGSISLPHGIGKSRKVIAFCDGDDVEKAKAAGATEAGSDELVKKVQDGWVDFDVAVSTPGMMKLVSRLGRILGPQGKMPSPKSGTVVEDVATAVQEYGAGKVAFRSWVVLKITPKRIKCVAGNGRMQKRCLKITFEEHRQFIVLDGIRLCSWGIACKGHNALCKDLDCGNEVWILIIG